MNPGQVEMSGNHAQATASPRGLLVEEAQNRLPRCPGQAQNTGQQGGQGPEQPAVLGHGGGREGPGGF